MKRYSIATTSGIDDSRIDSKPECNHRFSTHQELRRLRRKAAAVVNTDGIESPLYPSQEEASNHRMPRSRSELPSPVVGAENGTACESSTPSPLGALPYRADQTASARGLMLRRRREHGTFMQAAPERVHDTSGCSGHDRRSKQEFITIKDGLTGGGGVGWSDGSTGSFPQAPVRSLRDGKHELEAPTYHHLRGPADATRGAAATGFSGHQEMQFGSEGRGGDVPKHQSGCSDETGDGCAEDREEEDEELSLDLSDCSNEVGGRHVVREKPVDFQISWRLASY